MVAVNIDDHAGPKLRELPIVNLMDFSDSQYAEALLEEALPHDRDRFRGYLTERPLGLGLMTAGPGFGKTTAIAVATLAMQASLGRILCSAPTNVAVDNFANRLDRITASVCARRNKGLSEDDPARARHRLVICAYRPADEFAAFTHLLRYPTAEHKLPGPPAGRFSKWQLPLSVASWLLMLLRSQATGIRQLHPDDCPTLHMLRDDIDSRPHLANLRDLATGAITWDEFVKAGVLHKDHLSALLDAVIEAADMLCTTPAMASAGLYKKWQSDVAKGVAVDEAANITRADLACVWGNTMLPCFLAGDPKQLPPTVMSGHETDAEGNVLHRFPLDAKLSALEYFQSVGMPVYRLETQLRMAQGMFDMVAKRVYPEVPFTYSSFCDVDLPAFEVGRELEAYVQDKHPTITAAEPGKLRPIFVHCEGARVWLDKLTGAKTSKDQVKMALDFAVNLLAARSKVKSSNLVIIAPYASNVAAIKKMLREEPYAAALPDVPPPSTVHGFQGKEGDIVLLVMGTNKLTGPGFTTDEQRLNVALTRQRCGLVIFGDITIFVQAALLKVGPGGEVNEGKDKGKGKGKRNDAIRVVGPDGATTFTKAVCLRAVYNDLFEAGRVVSIDCK
ncbi:hypothetical protein ACHAQA_008017 [Verticillium albo-atrum]